jgi:hypothetical protein
VILRTINEDQKGAFVPTPNRKQLPIDASDDEPFNPSLAAGQSGGSQGLSQQAESASESVEELADSGQALEADVIAGVEDAADHPERPVHTHADYRKLSSVSDDDATLGQKDRDDES